MSNDSFLKKLTGFTPESSGLDRDQLMFAAGQASARKGQLRQPKKTTKCESACAECNIMPVR